MQTAQACLDELTLLSATQSSDPAKRREALRRVTDLFIITASQQTVEQSEIFGEAMRHIAGDVDEEARSELSERIAKRPSTPRQLALQLAQDTIVVARPILEHAASLSSSDLVDLAQKLGQGHLLAISRRADIPSDVTDVLAERGDQEVRLAVAANAGAQFSPDGLGTLVQRSMLELDVNEALAQRNDVPNHMRKAIHQNVASACEAELAAQGLNCPLAEFTAQQEETAAAFPTMRYKAQTEELHRRGALSEDTIARFAKARAKDSAAYAVALLADLDVGIVGRCLCRGSPIAVAIILKAVGCGKATLVDIVGLRKPGPNTPPDFLPRTSEIFDVIDRFFAERILRFLRVRIAMEAGAA